MTWTPLRVAAAYAVLIALLYGANGKPMLGGVCLLVSLLLLVRDANAAPRTDEIVPQPDHAVDTRRWLSMDLALTDHRGVCWICQQDAAVLELLDVGSRYELACLACASVLKAPDGEKAA
jgi:hypothetical protein